MGQKVNPNGLRVGPTLIKGWQSLMYAEKEYGSLLLQDLKIRSLVKKDCESAFISKVIIERPSNKSVVVNIHAKKPGAIIGKSGGDIEILKKKLVKITNSEVFINIHEVKKPDIDSELVAQTIAKQLEKRVSFRRAMKRSIQASLKQGAKGIRVSVSGRLGGAEIARTEWYREGGVPLHTLRADISYSISEAKTTYGVLGVKVWIYKGDLAEIKKRDKELVSSVKLSAN
ncbi:MAG: 30S ribosomal protein S3 [Rickettsiaceae bacterium]|nr:30S ribosomal protein S3 [Rickettsiaceae bacterium]